MHEHWIIANQNDDAVRELAGALHLHPIAARVLMGRGISTVATAKRYLRPDLADLPSPFDLPGMDIAVQRLGAALARRERIVIFGDYDVDGVSGAALLHCFLRALGASPRVALPSRHGEGYGLSPTAVEALSREGVDCIVTVDNGMRATEAVERARALGIDVIVTDHHEAGSAPPAAVAVVNPKREGTPAALCHLSGCGVAFMVALALRRHLRDMGTLPSPEPNLRQHLDLAALGTIADAVALVDANRIIACHGMTEIARSSKIGLQALLDVSGTDPARLSAGAVAFQLAPRLNAAGRLSDAARALDLLLCQTPDDAWAIARELDGANRERQRIEERILSEAMAMAAADETTPQRAGLVLSSAGWHVGVIGIVAAKLAERYKRPAVVITRDTVPARGSARGFTGVHIARALEHANDLLLRHGGHAAAGGCSLDEEMIAAFADRFDDACRTLAAPAEASALAIDAAATPEEISGQLAEDLAAFAPFGAGNPEPVLALSSLDVTGRRTVGNGHVRLRLRSQGIHFDAIGFNMERTFPNGAERIDIAFVPELNTWQGVTTVQLKLRAVRPAQ